MEFKKLRFSHFSCLSRQCDDFHTIITGTIKISNLTGGDGVVEFWFGRERQRQLCYAYFCRDFGLLRITSTEVTWMSLSMPIYRFIRTASYHFKQNSIILNRHWTRTQGGWPILHLFTVQVHVRPELALFENFIVIGHMGDNIDNNLVVLGLDLATLRVYWSIKLFWCVHIIYHSHSAISV